MSLFVSFIAGKPGLIFFVLTILFTLESQKRAATFTYLNLISSHFSRTYKLDYTGTETQQLLFSNACKYGIATSTQCMSSAGVVLHP